MYRLRKILLLVLTSILLIAPATITQAATRPGTVKLTKITAADYNKINIKWKKVSGATNYIVYYKKAGGSKWIKVKTLAGTKASYTHTSSAKYPIVVGQKYTYTVKAYNSKTKKAGSYNTTGLTTSTSLKAASGLGVAIDKNNHVIANYQKNSPVFDIGIKYRAVEILHDLLML